MTIHRIIAGLLAGAVIGALLIAAWYLYGQLEVNGFNYVLKYGPRNGFAVFAMAFGLWLAGMVLLASPLWWLLHRLNMQSWKAAGLLGFGLMFVVTLALSTKGFGLLPATHGSTFSAGDSGGPTWINNELTFHGWVQAFWSSVWFGFAGICSAFATWRITYKIKSKAEKI